MFYVLSMPDLSLQEMVYILDAAEELKVMTLSSDYGKHLLGVEDLLQKHSLVEADINVLGDRVKTVATVSIQKHVRLQFQTVPTPLDCRSGLFFNATINAGFIFRTLNVFSPRRKSARALKNFERKSFV